MALDLFVLSLCVCVCEWENTSMDMGKSDSTLGCFGVHVVNMYVSCVRPLVCVYLCQSSRQVQTMLKSEITHQL